MVRHELPWPPSLNHYYRRVGRKVLISRGGRAYREIVCSIVAARGAPMHRGQLYVDIECYPPDLRKRDLDNLPKAILDALEHAGAIENDAHIRHLSLHKENTVPGGRCIVTIASFQ